MTRISVSFVLGVAVGAIVLLIGQLALTVALDSAGAPGVDVHLGDLGLYHFGRSPEGVSSQLQPGVLVVLALCGALNALAARSPASRRPTAT
jgi:hypothetical protein